MTDQLTALESETSPANDQASGAGLLLQQARQAAGLHIATLAVAIKVPVKKLEALEAERFDLLNDAVFVRALAATVCRKLKIDPQPILEKLPRSALLSLQPVENLNQAPFPASFQSASHGIHSSSLFSRPVLALVLALLLAAGLLAYVPLDFPQLLANAGFANPVPAPVATALVETVVASESAPVVSNPEPLAPVPLAVSEVGLPAPSKALESTLVFKQQGAAWLQVNDGRGQSLLNRHANSGETVSVTGILPLSVVVGRANVTEVLVSGKPFDLSAVSQGNVARFEVK
ncbi:MAG: helix-turn-helix domain-containing protein [Burkholderiaceae bacterium]